MFSKQSRLPTALAAVAGYALGTIPSADLAARAATKGEADLRTRGSANPGAMNAGQTLGPTWGVAVLLGDVGKGWVAAAVGRQLAGTWGANLAASAAVAGHCYPPGRSGGKGVSTSIGQVIGTFPYYLPLDIAVGLATAALPKWTQRTWAATAVASTTWIGSSIVAYRRGWPTGAVGPATAALPIGALLSSAIITKRFLDTPLVDGKPRDDDGVSSTTPNDVNRSDDVDSGVHRLEQPAEQHRAR